METDYISYLESLPYLALADIFSRLDYVSIMHICQSSSILQEFCESGYIDKLLKEKLRIYNMVKRKAEIHYDTLMFKDTQGTGYSSCDRLSKRQLIDIMWDIQVTEPPGIVNDTNMTRMLHGTLTPEEINIWPINKLRYYYKWLKNTRLFRTDICNIIKDKMIALNIISNVYP